MLIDFEGFIQLTEELGGVKVCNKYASVSWGYSFPVGNVNLRGEQALAYVRERRQLPHGISIGPSGSESYCERYSRKGLAKETMTNPFKLVNFVRGVSQHVSVDDGLTERKLRKMALSLRLSPDDIHLLQALISGLGTSPTRQSIDIVEERWLNLRKRCGKTKWTIISRTIQRARARGKARARAGSTIPGHPSTWDIAEALNRWPLAVRLGPCVGSGECCPWQSLPFSLHSTQLS